MDQRLPQPLDCSNLAREWPKWKQQFHIFMIASNRNGEPERNKIATFLWLIGERGVEIYNTLFPNAGDVDSMFSVAAGAGAAVGQGSAAAAAVNATGNVNASGSAAATIATGNENAAVVVEVNIGRTLAQVIEAFDRYCLPRKNIAMEAFKFNMIEQKEKQSFADFETALRTQLTFCEFECSACHASYADRMLRDRIIIGVQDKKLQLKLLDGKDEPLQNIVETCKIFEAAAENKQLLDGKAHQELHTVVAEPAEEIKQVAVVKTQMCFNCGQPFNGRHRRYCPARNVNCDACGRLGHYKKFCKASKPEDRTNRNSRAAFDRYKRTGNSEVVHAVNWRESE